MTIGEELSSLWATITAADSEAFSHSAAFLLLLLFWASTRAPRKKRKDTDTWHDNRRD